jgi:uncharacterized protein (TIGR03083 family)
MENSRLLACLADDYERLRDVAARDLTAAVPSCPGWTAANLVGHVAEVYLHKTEAMRLAAWPDPWPPELSGEEPIALLDRAYAALTAEFAARAPGDKAATWYDPDQTVGFWIRRMAQETVIHRLDAELALGETVAPIPDDLALDGIDEVLHLFLAYGSQVWAEYFASALKGKPGYTISIRVPGGGWLVTTSESGVEVVNNDAAEADATVSGAPDAVLRWLWARGEDSALTIHGADEAVAELRGLLVLATQ